MAILLAAAVLAGVGACVVDGETFHLDSCKGTTIKVYGIDSPSRGDKSAGEATVALSRLVDRQQVRCEEKGKAGKAVIAQCFLGERDLADILVAQGVAKAAPAPAASAKAPPTGAVVAAPAKPEKNNAPRIEQVAASPAARGPVSKVSPTPAPTKTAAPVRPARPVERRIGEVTVLDLDNDPYIRLEGPKRELTYEQRLQLSTFVLRESKSSQYTLTIFSTHHDEAARAYASAMTDASEKLDMSQAVKPNKQCVRNQDGKSICFVDEGYAINLPENLLRRARAKGQGLRLQLAGGGAAKPMLVSLDAAMIEGQMRALDEVVRTLGQ